MEETQLENQLNESFKDIVKFNKNKITVNEKEQNEMVISTNDLTNEITDQIKSMTLITPSDIAAFKSAQAFVLSTYTDVPQYRPLMVKLTSVLNDGQFPTPDSKFWQCKAEAEVHFNEMARGISKYKKGIIDINEIDYKIRLLEESIKEIEGKDSDVDPNLVRFDIQRLSVKREQYEFELKQLEKTIKYRMEEVSDWSSIASTLEDKCEFSTKVHGEHYAKAFIMQLEHKISKAKSSQEEKMLRAQLDTFKRLTKEKFDELTKKGGN
jgi:hypothetical protein